jgi:hypothetical protein
VIGIAGIGTNPADGASCRRLCCRLLVTLTIIIDTQLLRIRARCFVVPPNSEQLVVPILSRIDLALPLFPLRLNYRISEQIGIDRITE